MSLTIQSVPVKGKGLAGLLQAYQVQVKGDADEVARQQIGEMRSDIIRGWPIDTTASRGAWQGPTKIGEAHYQLRNDYPYAATIEYGGYPGVGPKTEQLGAQVLPGGIEINGGIYPTQKPAAPVRQAISKRKVFLMNALSNVMMRKSGFRGFAGGGTSGAFRG